MNFLSTIRARLAAEDWKPLFLLPVFWALAVALQHFGGAYDSEFGGHPDEAAHYVTGLMIRDYLAAGLPGNPLKFAQDYYDHYPKVALGNWPPVFYLIQSAWTLPFSPSRMSVLLLMAALAALTAGVLFKALLSEMNRFAAAVLAAFFLFLPLVQAHTGMVMTEIPVTLFTFTAALFFGRYLDRAEKLDALAFGFFASLAIMTKGTGLMLALVPPFAMLLTRRFALLKARSLWASAVMVAVLCGPWMFKFREVSRAGWMEGNPSWNFTKQALVYYPTKLVLAVGLGLAFLAALGFVSKLFLRPAGRPPSGKWAAAGALIVGGLVFHAVVPCGLEPRHLTPLLPAVLMFVVHGVWVVAGWFKRPPAANGFGLAEGILIFAITLLGPGWVALPKGYTGFAPIAARLLAAPENQKLNFLVSSDARGEGQFISEVAMREKRPGHIVRRASKVLASSTWGGQNYQAKAGDEAAVLALLDREKIAVVVADTSMPKDRQMPHHELLRTTLQKHPEQFEPLGKFPVSRAGELHGGGIEVYQRRKL